MPRKVHESINEIESIAVAQVEINVTPNPVENSFILEVNTIDAAQSEVLVYNLSGVMMYRELLNQTQTVDCSKWAAGMYIVRVGDTFKKIIKN